MSDNKSGGLLSGLLIGTALGAVAGILATPRTGKETRRVLKKSADALPELAEDLATSVQFQADRLSATALGNWEGTLERLREAIAAGQIASQQEWSRQTSDLQTSARQTSVRADRHKADRDMQYAKEDYSPIPTEVATANRTAAINSTVVEPSTLQTHAPSSIDPQKA